MVHGIFHEIVSCLSYVSMQVLFLHGETHLSLKAPKTKIAEFANSVGPAEADHNEPPHQDLHCMPSSL